MLVNWLEEAEKKLPFNQLVKILINMLSKKNFWNYNRRDY